MSSRGVIWVGLSLCVGCGGAESPALSVGQGLQDAGAADVLVGDVRRADGGVTGTLDDTTDDVAGAAADVILEDVTSGDAVREDALAADTTAGVDGSALSCVGRCGAVAGPDGCGCTVFCAVSGNCCADYDAECGGQAVCGDGKCGDGELVLCPADCPEEPVGSCEGRCGEYQDGAPCNCDDECGKYQDCCPDLKAVCSGGPVCGDGTCEGGESVASCPADCGEQPGPLKCVLESCETGACDSVPGCWDAVACLVGCAAPESAQACGDACMAGQPLPAKALLGQIQACIVEKGCAVTPECGDGVCSGPESAESCPDDCQPADACGDGTCGANETPTSCPGDCGPALDGSCAGYCGGQSADGCYCDEECAQYGDCCEDYQAQCLASTGVDACLLGACDGAAACLNVGPCAALLACLAECGGGPECAAACVAGAPLPSKTAVTALATCGTAAGCFATPPTSP